MSNSTIRTSKFLSLILRHRPETIELELDANGWANIDEIVTKANAQGKNLNHQMITDAVANNDKQRFSISDDGAWIRANQGHSIDVDLGLTPAEPPPQLFHGTAARALSSIMSEGLTKQRRHHVHLSENIDTASAVGRRYGKLVLLAIDTAGMRRAGHDFFLSANDVWLTDHVPANYLAVHA